MSNDDQIFRVSSSMDFFSRIVSKYPDFWRKVGDLETKALKNNLADIILEKPVYVTGLARSGSTVLLETLAQIPGVASHRYKDFPMIYSPYWWNWFLKHASAKTATSQERAHRDGIMVTLDSPEAMEEVIWMGAFEHLHNPLVSNVLSTSDCDPEFDRFYKEHLAKLLFARQGKKYLSKGNYLISRLDYIQNMFPDARFITPVRHPLGHIASLMKQHDLFIRGQTGNNRARNHLKRVGHLEFGLDRSPINTGDTAVTQSILKLWKNGEEVRGWARYWNQVYAFLGNEIDNKPKLKEASQLVRFEELCEKPSEIITNMLEHCGYPIDPSFVESAASRIRAPNYYKPKFTKNEEAIILDETSEARAILDY